MLTRTRLTVGLLAVISLLASVPSSPARAITESQVEEACANSRRAYDTYQTARAEFREAAVALEEANAELDDAEYQEQRIRGIYEGRQAEQTRLQSEVDAKAAELYMQAAAGPSTIGMFSLSSPGDALVGLEFLESNTSRDLQSVNDLASISGELDRLGGDLEQAVAELTDVRDEQANQTQRQEEAMATALDAYDQLDDQCRELQAEYEAEQARLRAEAEARRQREAAERERASSGGGTGRVVGGIVCPFTPGRTQFIDSWGYPRSGGRSHKGVDMFAPWDDPVYAVTSGRITKAADHGLGGKHIWLTANNGTSYYYAHLNSFAVSAGQSVSQGDLIGYNGNSGNARGTSPHVHLQIHPNGAGGSAVNPYPSVAAVCF